MPIKTLLFRLMQTIALLVVPASARAQDMTVALGGDMIGPYRSLDGLDDPGFAAAMALFREADVGFSNQEGAIFDLADFAGHPAAETGGGYPLSPGIIATQLRENGISLVSKANNHGTDWGVPGLLASLASLADAGIAFAGAGADPQSACAPVVRTSKAGRIALVSAATTFPPMSLPVAPVNRRGLVSRPGPGICAIHVQMVRLVTQNQLDTLRQIAGPVAIPAGANGRDARIGDQIFRLGPPGQSWEMKADDVARVLDSLRGAKPRTDLLLFAVHAHETAGTVDEMPAADFEPLILHRANEAPDANNAMPADYVPRLLHAAVDAGADMVVRTGPHLLNGIEIYRGKPIFYSLGSLFFDFGGRRSYTAPGGQTITLPGAWYETVIPRLSFRQGILEAIRLYPAIIDPDAGPGGGLPHLATGASAQRILSRLRDLSRAYGTQIAIEGDVGVIKPAP